MYIGLVQSVSIVRLQRFTLSQIPFGMNKACLFTSVFVPLIFKLG